MKNGEHRQNDTSENISIDQQLVEEGLTQLANEIKVLENWLQELDSSDEEDSEVLAAKKSYHDMLRSRREMLSALNQHADKENPRQSKS